jgi:excisionase family DNA binding protein
MLTTREAAALAGVTPSTIKRWADQGILPVAKTLGGHRRFERGAVERVLRQRSGSQSTDPFVAMWIDSLVRGDRYEIDGHLLYARSRLGAWHRVADEIGAAVEEMGRRWQAGEMSIADEHFASYSLMRALARIGETFVSQPEGAACLLACAPDDEHQLGLALAELCLREVGVRPRWLGSKTPADEIVRVIESGGVQAVAVSASRWSTDAALLATFASRVGGVCERRNIDLVFGGSGAWPTPLSHGVRMGTFGDYHERLRARRFAA